MSLGDTPHHALDLSRKLLDFCTLSHISSISFLVALIHNRHYLWYTSISPSHVGDIVSGSLHIVLLHIKCLNSLEAGTAQAANRRIRRKIV